MVILHCMKWFLILAATGFAFHHFVVAERGGADPRDVVVELPAGFEPERMSVGERQRLKSELQGELVRLDAFIANPPI